MRRGNKAKRERGWLQHANLNGYLNAPNPNQLELDPTESITVKDPERFDLLRKAWGLLLTGEYGVPVIPNILNNEWDLEAIQVMNDEASVEREKLPKLKLKPSQKPRKRLIGYLI